MDEQLTPKPSNAGVAPWSVARPAKAMTTAPFAWSIAVGTGWHSEHAAGPASVPAAGLTCARCAPTARVVGSVSPRVPSGGAALTFASAPAGAWRAGSPWQLWQP